MESEFVPCCREAKATVGDLPAGLASPRVGRVTSAVVTRRIVSRLFSSFVIAVTILLIVATSIAVLIGLARGPHEAAQDLETTIGAYWPLILVFIAVLTGGIAAVSHVTING